MSLISLARRGRAVALVAGALMLVPVLAEARPGGGKGFGSRGSRTTQQVAPTQTAPTGAAPMQRTATPAPSASAAAPGAAAAAQAARPSFARNMMMGIGAGLLGAGLFGLLSGAGFGGLAGMLGMLFQVALIGGLIWLALRFFRRRAQPQQQFAAAGAPLDRAPYQPQQEQPQAAQRMGGMMGGMGAATAAAKPVEFELAPADYGSFERLLNDVQMAYSNEDLATLRQLATPEMAGYFAEDIAENASKGLVDRVADVKLLQGDLSQAWNEGDLDYATVAMRFSLINAAYDRKTGKIVDGSATQTQEVSEYWTFVRERGGAWKLSGIQQAA